MPSSKKTTPKAHSSRSSLAAMAMALAMKKASDRNQDPSLAARAAELQAEAYDALRAGRPEMGPTLN